MSTTAIIPDRPVSADAHFEEFARLRRLGWSYQAIGDRFGLSNERVRQVLWRNDETGEFRRSSARHKRAEQFAEVKTWIEANGPVERNRVIEHFGITANRLNSLISDGLPSHLLLTDARDVSITFTDDIVHDALRRAWDELKATNPDAIGLSHVSYERLRRISDPSAPLIIGRYGWAKVCDAAGVPSGETWRREGSYQSRWSDEDLLRAVGQYAQACIAEHVRPTYLGYERYQMLDDSRPSGTLVRNRMRHVGLTTWPSIVVAATTFARNEEKS